MKTPMKKAITLVVQVLATTIIFTVCLYLWYLIDHGIKEFDWSLLVQGLLFSLLFVPVTNYWNKKKSK